MNKLIIIGLLNCWCFAAWSATEPVVLITAFKPFAGRGVNGSATLAYALERQGVPGHRLAVQIIPVIWGEPERVLPETVQRLRPVLVLGLGEGHPGRIAFERFARNRANGPDERGKPPPSHRILAMGLEKRRSTLGFDAAWFTGLAHPMTTSDDAGDYLCNNLFYVALGLDAARTGFVHVPPQGDTPETTYVAEQLPALTTLISKTLATPRR
jgi:pyroglutamyl-peptidase